MRFAKQKQLVMVWDWPVRVFHWLLVTSFTGAWLTSENEAQQMLHYAFGYSACALVVLRVLWGIVGTRYARFSEFVKGPRATFQHIKSMLAGQTTTELGHNPAGALAMVLLMVLTLLIGLTGYWSVKEFLGEWMSEAHEVLANLALVVIAVHVLAAILMSYLQRENLVKSMVTGNKNGTTEQGIRYPMNLIGVVLALAWASFMYLIVIGAVTGLTQ
jgi:cytochrome b